MDAGGCEKKNRQVLGGIRNSKKNFTTSVAKSRKINFETAIKNVQVLSKWQIKKIACSGKP